MSSTFFRGKLPQLFVIEIWVTFNLVGHWLDSTGIQKPCGLSGIKVRNPQALDQALLKRKTKFMQVGKARSSCQIKDNTFAVNWATPLSTNFSISCHVSKKSMSEKIIDLFSSHGKSSAVSSAKPYGAWIKYKSMWSVFNALVWNDKFELDRFSKILLSNWLLWQTQCFIPTRQDGKRKQFGWFPALSVALNPAKTFSLEWKVHHNLLTKKRSFRSISCASTNSLIASPTAASFC